jgi:hypothetical protein
MTTPTELKDSLTKQYQETLNTLLRLEGAIAALNELTADDPVVEPDAEAE